MREPQRPFDPNPPMPGAPSRRLADRLRARFREIVPPSVVAEVRLVEHGGFATGSADAAARRPRTNRGAERAAGRACANEAIGRLGIAEQVSAVMPDGAPRWPDGLVGSISHSGGVAAAAVARRTDLEGLGLDLLAVRPLDAGLAPMFATESELTWLYARPVESRLCWMLLLFAAKESFQKCARPVLRYLPDPRAIEIRVDAATSSLEADLEGGAELAWRGRFAIEAGYLLAAATAVAVAKPARQRTTAPSLPFVPRSTPVR